MSRFWSSVVHTLTPYVPGEQPKLPNLIKLNTNENPYPPSPKVLEAISLANQNNLKRYPDPNSDALKNTIAKHFGLENNQIFTGNGSDEILAHIFFGLLKHDLPVLFPDITYSFYPVYCELYEITTQKIPVDDKFAIQIQDYRIPNGGIIFPNPNAPTGQAMTLDQIDALLQFNTNSVVVIDEAYVDFGTESAVSLIKTYPNLLVVHTLSKSRSLAGLRVGYAMGDSKLIEALERVKNCFNSYPLDQLAQAGAVAAFQDQAYFQQTCQAVMGSREWLSKELDQLGFQVLPSRANFVFARHSQHDAAQLATALRKQNIIVRHFKLARIDQFLRITVGTNEECATLIAALKQILSA
ncbi:histidinol-phosphate transaminase [Ampullimonas aquatilis]|uniref:histidinol-phosphate transaminase n=1 Tax=Ampullimonas aquatilis TaxID=1341549 RepID=UPI003C7771E1